MSEQYLEKLIKKVSKLPGLGPRSSRRVVLHLLKDKEKLLLPLIEDLTTVANNIRSCMECGNLDENKICQICKDSSRNQNLLCVVETVADLWALERSNVYNGKYHILGGVLSAIDGVNPEQLNIASLEKRLENKSIAEIIIRYGCPPTTLEAEPKQPILLNNTLGFRKKNVIWQVDEVEATKPQSEKRQIVASGASICT